MTYNITLTNGNSYATVNDGTIVTNTSTITLVGKNYAGYGAILDENFVHLMENSANGTAPTGAVTGQLWYDTTNRLLKQYNGSMFRALTAVTSSNAAPTLTAGFSAVSGDLWYDTVNAQLNVYTGNAWLVTGPAFTSSQGTSGAIVKTVNDIFLQPHTVVELYTGGNIVGIISQDSTFTPQTAIPGFPTVSPGIQLANAVNNVVPGFTCVGNISTSGYVLGNGSLLTGVGSATSLVNGNSNIIISPANGPIKMSVNGAANVAVVNSGNVVVTGDILATGSITGGISDDRLKTNLGKIDGALDKVAELTGFYYESNELAKSLGYGDLREVGLSAQTLQRVLPETVAIAAIAPEYLTIRYDRVVPLLVEAIKEIAKQVDELRTLVNK